MIELGLMLIAWTLIWIAAELRRARQEIHDV
jgi:hypothetical protein